jgi:hypothetical protein
LVTLSIATLGIWGCGDEEGTPLDGGPIIEVPDTIAPAPITDLRLRSATYQSLALVWTAPGDDGDAGTADHYDIRISTTPITEQDFETTETFDSMFIPVPKPAGQIEQVVARGLDSATRYYFALKTSDEAGNTSAMSNCATEETHHESFPPSNVTDLKAGGVDPTTFEITFTAVGDDYWTGTAEEYDIRYALDPIMDETRWNTATRVSPTPAPKPSGETEIITIPGLVQRRNYYFAVKTADEEGNWSALSNSAPGLAFDNILWVDPIVINEGEFSNILFRPAPVYPTTVTLHSTYTLMCGTNVLKILYTGTTNEVGHITYDFFDPDTQSYLPPDTYTISVCHGSAMEAREFLTLR